jgi:hypothetical protein
VATGPKRPTATFYAAAIANLGLLVATFILALDESVLAIATGLVATLGSFSLARRARAFANRSAKPS